MSEGLEIVNVVGSGEFDLELDLTVLARDLGDVAEYDPDGHTGMHIRLNNGALVTLYRTGSYHIVGIASVAGLADAGKNSSSGYKRLTSNSTRERTSSTSGISSAPGISDGL